MCKYLAEWFASEFKVQIYKVGDSIPEDCSGFVNLLALDCKTVEEALLCNETSFDLAQKLSSKKPTFICVTQHSNAEIASLSGGLWGLCKTIRQEWNDTFVKCISLKINNTAESIARSIYEEIYYGGSECEVILDSERKTFATIPTAPVILNEVKDRNHITANSHLEIHKTDILVVTGGARGITAACLIEFAKTSPCRILILGRSPIFQEQGTDLCKSDEDLRKYFLSNLKQNPLTPKAMQKQIADIQNSREIKKTLETLELLNCDVIYNCVDSTNSEKVKESLQNARKKWNANISGIIHGAGVLQDKLIGDASLEQWRLVFNTKVLSALNLLKETQEDSLKLICFFSSVAARWGNRGQSSYAMANEVLNKIAEYEKQKRPHCQVKSIDWGPWAGGMVNEQIRKVFEDRNVGLLEIEEGATAFVQEIFDKSCVETVIARKPVIPFLNSNLPDFYLEGDFVKYDFHLEDHKIQNNCVVPFALIADWALKIAESHRPDLQSLMIEDAVCFKGILISKNSICVQTVLEHNDAETAKLIVSFSSQGRMFYRVNVLMKREQSTHGNSGNSDRITEPELKSRDLNFTYDAPSLFHGPQYQVLESITKLNSTDAEAIVNLDSTDLEPRMIALDAAIQLAVLWMERFAHGFALPTRLQNLKFNSFEISGRVSMFLKSELKNSSTGLFSISIINEQGEIFALLEKLEMTVYSPLVTHQQNSPSIQLSH